MSQDLTRYCHTSKDPSCANAYLWPSIKREIIACGLAPGARIFDLGCGNGTTASLLHGQGFDVTGVDSSSSGIELARLEHRDIRFENGSAYDDLAAQYGRFPVVVSLEVIEHVFDPRHFARTLFDLVEQAGLAIVSTPYHGYVKNIALALSGKLESLFTVLWDGGHVKFFSINTLGSLPREAGFTDLRFIRVGRVPALAKSMVAIARRSVA